MMTVLGSALSLEPSREVRRFADHVMLVRRARGDQIADEGNPLAMPTLACSGPPMSSRSWPTASISECPALPWRARRRPRLPADSRNTPARRRPDPRDKAAVLAQSPARNLSDRGS